MYIPKVVTSLLAIEPPTGPVSLPLPHTLVAQLPVGFWIENIAVRPNGALLLTTPTPNASIYEISTPWSANASVNLLHTFTEVTSLFGITETRPDVFVAAGFSFVAGSQEPQAGSAVAVELDLNNRHDKPTSKVVARLPDAKLLNGIAALPDNPTTVLIADSFAGVAWRVDTTTGTATIGINVTELAPRTIIGVNGMKVHRGHLYWTNSDDVGIYRVAIDGQTGSVASGASVEKVANLTAATVFVDDFAFGPCKEGKEDVLWAMTNAGNSVLAVYPNGTSVEVEGADVLAADTAGAFGRVRGKDDKVLYVVTAGNTETGGQVVAVDTSGFC